MRSDQTSRVTLASTVVRGKDPLSADLRDEVVILALSTGEYYGLQAIGARIWKLIEEPTTVKDVLGALLEEYDVEPVLCERDLLTFLQQLVDAELGEVSGGTTP